LGFRIQAFALKAKLGEDHIRIGLLDLPIGGGSAAYILKQVVQRDAGDTCCCATDGNLGFRLGFLNVLLGLLLA
jgi:hypothetical protein